jgi:hypothetical protein
VPTNETYQNFTDNACDSRIPVNDYVEEFDFAQFLRLYFIDTATGDANDTRRWPIILGKIREAMGGKARAKKEGVPAADGAPLLDLIRGKGLGGATPPRPRITLDNVDAFIASGTLSIGDRVYRADRSPKTIETLLRGQDVDVPVTDGEKTAWVTLSTAAPTATIGVRPVVSRWPIENLSAFLSNPAVPGVDGATVPLTLKPAEVAALRKKGVVKASAGGQDITFYAVKAPPKDSEGGGVGNGTVYDNDNHDFDFDEPPTGGSTGGTSGTTGGAAGTTGTSTTGGITPPPEIRPEPSRTPAVFQVALILPWKQTWTLLGYSRGRLLHSLALAPGEETVLEVFSWDRRKRTLEQTSSTDTEQSSDVSNTSKDTLDVYQEMVNTGEFYREGRLNLVGQYGKSDDTHVKLDVNGKLTGKDTVARTAKNTAHRLQESVVKASTRVKVSRTSKVTESVESGREDRVTRKVRNPNACNTLSLDYFELTANYRVDTSFVEENAVLVAMVPNPLRLLTFERETLRVHESALRRALLDDNLASGFDAARLLRSRQFSLDLACEELPCAVKDTGTKTTGTNTQTPVVTEPDEWKVVPPLLAQIADAVHALATARIDPYLSAYDDGDGRAETPPTSDFLKAKRWLFVQLMFRFLPTLMAGLNRSLQGGTAAVIAKDLYAALPGMDAAYRPSTVGQATDTEKEKTVRNKVMEYHDKVLEYEWFINQMKDDGIFTPDDAGLSGLLDQFASAYKTYLNAKASASVPGAAVVNAATQEQKAQDRMDVVRFAFPIRDVADALEREEALLKHLNAHADYYRFTLFQSLPPAEQLSQLAGGAMGSLPPGIFQPRVVSWLGDHLAIPLNIDVDEGLREFLKELISDVGSQTTGLTKTVSLPTSGMSVESRRGRCGACDDHTVEMRRLDRRLREEDVMRAALENKRRETRIGEKLLDDPEVTSEPLRIRLDTPPAP